MLLLFPTPQRAGVPRRVRSAQEAPSPEGATGWSSGAAPPLARLIGASLVRAVEGANRGVKRCVSSRVRGDPVNPSPAKSKHTGRRRALPANHRRTAFSESSAQADTLRHWNGSPTSARKRPCRPVRERRTAQVLSSACADPPCQYRSAWRLCWPPYRSGRGGRGERKSIQPSPSSPSQHPNPAQQHTLP